MEAFSSIVVFPKIHNLSNQEKISDKFKLWDILQNTCLIHVKSIKVMKNKERLRNDYQQEDTAQT